MTKREESGLGYPHSRRGVLRAGAAGLGASALTMAGGGDIASGVDEPQTGDDPPAYPDDPFIQPSFGRFLFRHEDNFGYEAPNRQELLRILLGLHADVLAYDQLTKYRDGELQNQIIWQRQRELAETLDRPATSGWNVNIKSRSADALERYEPLIEAFDWSYPDGTTLDSARGILAETFDGDPYEIEFTFDTLGTPSVFAPGGLDLTVRATETQFERGYSGFFVDGVGVFRLQGLDFSRWAQAAFRDHLASLSKSRRAELGVEDPSSFDIRAYLRENGLAPEDDTDPRSDPLFREYLLHHHEGLDAWYDVYRGAVEERFPERMADDAVALYANQFTGNFGHPQAANVYVSDALDVIYTELFPRNDPAVDVNYKTMRSVGNFAKPVVAKGTLTALGEERRGAIDPESPNPNLLRFQAAEAYGAGARLQFPLTARAGYGEADSVTNWVGPDGTVPEELQAFADFLWTHERFLTDLEPAGDVAVVWSLSTLVWNHEPTWNIWGNEGACIDSFLGTASLLREAGLTYDVLTFGHPRLWDDAEQLDRLSAYEAVVLPAVECITDEQLSALEAVVESGTPIVSSGSLPNRDAFYTPREDVAEALSGNAVTVLERDPGRRYERDGTEDGTLINRLADSGVTSRRVGSERSIAVNAHTQSDPDRTVLALVNYAYDAETDTFTSKSDVKLRLPAETVADPVVRYYSPQDRTDLTVENGENGFTVTVPEVVEWGLVVVAAEAAAFVNGDRETARERTDAAREQLESVPISSDWTDGVVIAEAMIDTAETAIEHEAFATATDAAEEALAATEPLLPTPTDAPTSTDGDNGNQTDATGSPTSADATGSPASATSPGLSVSTALAAIASVLLALRRRDEED